MKKTKEEAEKTRQAILDAALEEFSICGYTRTRLDDVAKRAGVTRGAIYWHFENKPMLYTVLVRECHEEAQRRVNEAINQEDSAAKQIRKMAEILVQTLKTDSKFRAVNEITLFKTEFSDDLSHVLEEKRRMTRGFVDGFRQVIQAGIDSGELDPELDPQSMAWALLHLLQGVFMSWFWDPDAFELKSAVFDLIEMYLQHILRSKSAPA